MVTAPRAASDVVERDALRPLAARSDRHGMIQLASHTGALLATGVLVGQSLGTLWLGPAMLLHGVILVFLFAPLHETIHRTAFRSRRINDVVALVCGLPLALPPDYFRAFHFAHHRHTQDPLRDPELALPKPDSLWAYLRHVSGLPYWRWRLTTIVLHASGRIAEPFIGAHLEPKIVREARKFLAIYALVALISIATTSGAALVYWLIPALIGQPFLRCHLLAEHTGCPLIANMLENSRTTRSLAVVRRLAWNMPYHAEHHANPSLPFHALPAAHRLLADQITVQGTGYIAVNRAIVSRLQTCRPAA